MLKDTGHVGHPGHLVCHRDHRDHRHHTIIDIIDMMTDLKCFKSCCMESHLLIILILFYYNLHFKV